MTIELKNGIILGPEGSLESSSVCIEGNKIKGFDIPGDKVIDLEGKFILPGIIDIHGDGFERMIMPRPNSMIPFDLALRETDQQLLATGITTGFYGVSISWEYFKPLRNDKEARKLLDFFTKFKDNLISNSLVHLRFEIYHTDAIDWIIESMNAGMIDLISFNDHLEYLKSNLVNKSRLLQFSELMNLSLSETKTYLENLGNKKKEALEAVKKIAKHASDLNIPMASHDEEDESTRLWYHQQGCLISEFPCNSITAQKAINLGDWVVLGAPNALKGGSLYNRISAREALKKKYCHILASDYYYPSLLQIPFLLDELEIMDFCDAWNLVSANPAQACSLSDRGILAKDMLADIIVVSRNNGLAQCDLTMVSGKIVSSTGVVKLENNEKSQLNAYA